MSIYAGLSLGQSLPLPTKAQTVSANRPDTVQKTGLTDDAAAAVKQNYDVVTISEEAKAVAQALRITPVAGSSSEVLSLDAVGKPFEPDEIPDGTDCAALEAEKAARTLSDLVASRNALIEELKSECDNRPWYYSAETGLYYMNYSATTRLFQTRLWEWQENLRKNDPYAFELWVEKHGELKEPKFPEPGKGDLYQVIDLTPDVEGKTGLDQFHVLLQRMKDQAALIEKLYHTSKNEESDDSSATERVESQSAELAEDLQTPNSEVSEMRLNILDSDGPQQQEESKP